MMVNQVSGWLNLFKKSGFGTQPKTTSSFPAQSSRKTRTFFRIGRFETPSLKELRSKAWREGRLLGLVCHQITSDYLVWRWNTNTLIYTYIYTLYNIHIIKYIHFFYFYIHIIHRIHGGYQYIYIYQWSPLNSIGKEFLTIAMGLGRIQNRWSVMVNPAGLGYGIYGYIDLEQHL